MTAPQSKAEASLSVGQFVMNYCRPDETYLDAFVRYIEANPAISGEDRRIAGQVAKDFERYESGPGYEACRLLRLIAGPEEVDPLTDLARAICDGYSNGNLQWEDANESERDRCLEAARAVQAGYEITPMTKREGV